jgi:hypothetical protein
MQPLQINMGYFPGAKRLDREANRLLYLPEGQNSATSTVHNSANSVPLTHVATFNLILLGSGRGEKCLRNCDQKAGRAESGTQI